MLVALWQMHKESFSDILIKDRQWHSIHDMYVYTYIGSIYIHMFNQFIYMVISTGHVTRDGQTRDIRVHMTLSCSKLDHKISRRRAGFTSLGLSWRQRISMRKRERELLHKVETRK